jgi:hypothetical protein
MLLREIAEGQKATALEPHAAHPVTEPAQATLQILEMDVPSSEVTLVPWYATWNTSKARIALARVASLRSPNRAHLSGGTTQTRGYRELPVGHNCIHTIIRGHWRL